MIQEFEIEPAMAKRYLERRESDLDLIRVALLERRFEVIGNLGHQWKGNAESFGFPSLAEYGRDLETAAQDADIRRIERLSQEVADFVAARKTESRADSV